jgi:hypothetical protein
MMNRNLYTGTHKIARMGRKGLKYGRLANRIKFISMKI